MIVGVDVAAVHTYLVLVLVKVCYPACPTSQSFSPMRCRWIHFNEERNKILENEDDDEDEYESTPRYSPTIFTSTRFRRLPSNSP